MNLSPLVLSHPKRGGVNLEAHTVNPLEWRKETQGEKKKIVGAYTGTRTLLTKKKKKKKNLKYEREDTLGCIASFKPLFVSTTLTYCTVNCLLNVIQSKGVIAITRIPFFFFCVCGIANYPKQNKKVCESTPLQRCRGRHVALNLSKGWIHFQHEKHNCCPLPHPVPLNHNCLLYKKKKKKSEKKKLYKMKGGK